MITFLLKYGDIVVLSLIFGYLIYQTIVNTIKIKELEKKLKE